MQILSHRGWWIEASEKNTIDAFRRSLQAGFGIETDVRDLNGKLVISHDPPVNGAMTLAEFLGIYAEYDQRPTLALNIKADGLQAPLLEILASRGVVEYFVFDMSVPDQLGYVKRGANVFTRQSEYEPTPSGYEAANGVWLDAFLDDWVTDDVLSTHLAAGKNLCLVSPELHGRPYETFWRSLRSWEAVHSNRLMLCTDFPMKAREFFHD